VLVWDFVDLITPVMKLESPQEVFCFRLNPTQPDIAVGGTLSGQVSYHINIIIQCMITTESCVYVLQPEY
jgi:hypothetical protein